MGRVLLFAFGALLGALGVVWQLPPRPSVESLFPVPGDPAASASAALSPTAEGFSLPSVVGLPFPEERGQRPNILLIVVDSLRADRLGAYGSPYMKTPNIDALAEQGVRFTEAIS